jgi:epoxide hydrolase-like predicted phosphatase
MVRAVERLRQAGVKTALISNTWGPPMAYRSRALRRALDAVVRSDEVGLRKPDPEIYRLAAERLNVPPHDCVFIDDLLQNVDGARAAGMHAFVHRNADFTIPKLQELFGVSLAG